MEPMALVKSAQILPMELQGPSGEGLAERVISAISSARNAMARCRANIAQVYIHNIFRRIDIYIEHIHIYIFRFDIYIYLFSLVVKRFLQVWAMG